MNPGKRFEAKFHESLRRLPGVSMRIYDGGQYAKIQQMGDFLYWDFFGHTWLFECKATKEKSFPIAKLKDHQLEGLLQFDSLHESNHGIIAINFYGENVREKNNCYLVTATRYQHELENLGRSSFPEEMISEMGILCAPDKDNVWKLPLGKRHG